MSKLEVFNFIKETAHLGGGNKMVEMQHNLNKLTARERILTILDEGSFVEVGALISKNGAGVITGYGTIEGRLVFLYSHDYTVEGGVFTKVMGSKITNILNKAAMVGAPVIQILDSIGGKLTEGIELLSAYGQVLGEYGRLSGVIPRISIICGPCNGIMSILATMSDFVITVNELTDLSVSSIDEILSKEKSYVNESVISKGEVSNKNGNAHINTRGEKEAFEILRKIFSYLPSNNLELPLESEGDINLNIGLQNLDAMAENNLISLEEVLTVIADNDSIIEINKEFATNFKTALIKINGLTVGAILNAECKSIDNEGAKKVSAFIRLCDSFNISILTMVDTKGAVINIEEEKSGLAKNIGRLMYSLIDTKVPKVALIVGEAYGLGYEVLASKDAAFDIVMAWPNAKIGLINPENYIKSIHINEIFDYDNPKHGEKEVLSKYYKEVTSPYAAAEKGVIDDVIVPRETKQRIFAMLDMLQSKRELKYPKIHGTTLV